MAAEPKNNNRSIQIGGDINKSIVVSGNDNRIYYTTVPDAISLKLPYAAPSTPLSQQEYRWRKVLLNKVKYYWIDGVLSRSLYSQTLIELGLEKHGRAVVSPVTSYEELPEAPKHSLPKGTQIIDVFDDLGTGRTLLILGDPGSGKTTTLLKLVDNLINQLNDSLTQPIPVILNLSSWARERQDIETWLVQALHDNFQVSKSLGKRWIKDEQLLLCLDGLDEVAAQHRNTCVQALNKFIQSHGCTEIVVCSRIKDYESLVERLKLRSAICVQPLNNQQVDHYLEKVGKPLTALKIIFQHNSEIKSLAHSPLLLSIMSLTYQGSSVETLSQSTNAEIFRNQLFYGYVDRMFQRRQANQTYTREQTLRWLTWLANQMVKNTQTVFLIEQLQPSCLVTRTHNIYYRIECGLICGGSIGLLAGLCSWANSELSYGLMIGSCYGLVSGIVIASSGRIKPAEALRWSWQAFIDSAIPGSVTGAAIGATLGVIFGSSNRLSSWWTQWSEIQLSAFSISGFPARLITEVIYRGLSGISIGLVIAIICGLTAGLLGGFRGASIQKTTYPNQGIQKSALNALIPGIGFGSLLGIGFGMSTALNDTASEGLITGISSGLMYGLLAWLITGGAAYCRHYILRHMLYRQHFVAKNYVHFLNVACDQLFLQQVGGGYIFIHRLLLEHFATVTNEKDHREAEV